MSPPATLDRRLLAAWLRVHGGPWPDPETPPHTLSQATQQCPAPVNASATKDVRHRHQEERNKDSK